MNYLSIAMTHCTAKNSHSFLGGANTVGAPLANVEPPRHCQEARGCLSKWLDKDNIQLAGITEGTLLDFESEYRDAVDI